MAERACTPWNSIAEGIVADYGRSLAFSEARESPCASCPTSPCCTHLPLHTFQVRTLMELDHAIYLLNFDHLELGLSPSGEWSVYYRYPCRFLDRTDFSCRVHNAPDQPQICVNYNPYQCWYKRVLPRAVSTEFLRIDRPRLEYIVSLLTFDQAGGIIDSPDWATLVDGIARLPVETAPPASEPVEHDPARTAWRELAVAEVRRDEPPRVFSLEELRDPCAGCAAYCCTTLVFPHAPPTTVAALDFLRFCLGFPGIEVGIADEGWSLIVKTRCRHLRDNRCTVYGLPERPLLCRYYDAAKCTYRSHFGLPRPAGYLRLDLTLFPWLSECFRFDALGSVTESLPVEAIREHIEARWRAERTPATPSLAPSS
jgi:hypothetical protein